MLQSCFEYHDNYYVLVYDPDNSDCSIVKIYENGYFCKNLNCQSDKDFKTIQKNIKNEKIILKE